MNKIKLPIIALLLMISGMAKAADDNAVRIQPFKSNPHYWQYNGEPVLLIGGSKDDNLFQIPDLKDHLDLLVKVGGNVVRNTMSDRKSHGFEVYAFKELTSGKYDLNQWNPEYWKRFRSLLQLSKERGIIVQIEIWDRFDYTDHRNAKNWIRSPWNPRNNTNYTSEKTGLAYAYPEDHPSRDKQPFFHSVPAMEKYQPRYDSLRRYQERFVAQLLSISLDFPNVLYCMNNETTTAPEWGSYWINFIRKHASDKGVLVFCTDMFDDFHKGRESVKLPIVENDPGTYDFIDVSQVNSRNFNEDHWNAVYWTAEKFRPLDRPLNNTKIYSDGGTSWGSGTPEDGVERFWRNLIAGCASCRFHRPGVGIGLNSVAQACIKSVRKLESRIRFWNMRPRLDLLKNREIDEAYLSANPGQAYSIYFTDGGSVGLDLKQEKGLFNIEWIDVSKGTWLGDSSQLRAGRIANIEAPGKRGWIAVITR